MKTNGPIEPAAEIRQMAALLRETYIALMQEGFSEKEALTVVGQFIAANTGQASA